MTVTAYKTDKNSTLTFDELLNELKAQDESLHRYVLPAQELRVSDRRLVAGEQRIELTEDHFSDLCSAVSAPHAYLSRLGEPYRSYLLARHFANGDHLETLERRHLLGKTRRHKGAVAVVVSDGKFLGFARPDLQTLRAADVLDEIQQAVDKELRGTFDRFIVRDFNCNATSFELTVSTPSVTHEVTVGDVIEGGLLVRHSLTGIHTTQIEVYIHRLACENGAVRRECVASEKQGSARIRRCRTNRMDAVSQNLRAIFDHTSRVMKGLESKLQAVSKLREHKLDGNSGVRRFVDSQLRQISRLYSHRLLEGVMQAWSEEPESTAYGAWNALTRTATHAPSSKLRPTVRQSLFHLGGILGTRAEHICPRCYRMNLN